MVEQFADLSHHNTAVNLAAYAAAHRRVALKATDGAGFDDPAFAARWAAAGVLGLARVAYHYAQTETGGAQEADHILAIVTAAGGLGPDDMLCLDIEDNDSTLAVTRADEFAGEFCRQMVTRGHPTGLLYTGRWYADPAGITPADVPAGWRRLWLSDYSSATDAAMVLPAGWTRDLVAARQFTNAATVPGVAGPADCSRVINDQLVQEDTMALTTEDISALARAVWMYRIPDPHPEGDPAGAPAQSHLRWAQGRSREILERVGGSGAALVSAPPAETAAVLAAIAELSARVDALALAAGDPGAIRATIRAELDATRLTGPAVTP